MNSQYIRGHYGSVTALITEIDEHRFRATPDSNFYRFGTGDSGELTFVDFSGGPFVSVGSSLNAFHKKLPDKPITKIERNDEGIFLHV